MAKQPKMKLSDLKPNPTTEIKLDKNFTPDISIKTPKPTKEKKERAFVNQRVDWRESDKLFYNHCQQLLAYPLAFTKMLIDSKVYSIPNIDVEYIKQVAKNISVDAENLTTEYVNIRNEYESAKVEFKYEEDAMMAKLALTEQCSQWASTFEDLVVRRIDECIEYIKSFANQETNQPQ